MLQEKVNLLSSAFGEYEDTASNGGLIYFAFNHVLLNIITKMSVIFYFLQT